MKKPVEKHPRELSFTIFETIVAVGLLMAFALEMAAGQGNIVNKVEYARRSNEAIWLAKRIMSQVEYNYQTMDMKELDTSMSVKDVEFKDIGREIEFDYRYSIDVKEWKFPLFDFLLNGGMKDEEEENDPTQPDKPTAAEGMPGMDAILDQIFKGHIMKVAYVEVSWPDGARRDSVSLTYLLTNTKALDEYLGPKKKQFDEIIAKMQGGPATPDPTGPACLPTEPKGTTEPGSGCRYEDGSLRKVDGSIVNAEGVQTKDPVPPAPPPPGP
ncbi:MAG TPA: hypothetical protein VE954_42400 [Oligoflexus sp.]|uniref:hypothetical protein n=1 Tax=Oligoflexus sp. TaxID=1971216 RepID=UPI002D252045|nr:hypothetical protein [Oligoflexus sp.]HYX39793.1 hypothetical protein [Oligoflexus sp.]